MRQLKVMTNLPSIQNSHLQKSYETQDGEENHKVLNEIQVASHSQSEYKIGILLQLFCV